MRNWPPTHFNDTKLTNSALRLSVVVAFVGFYLLVKSVSSLPIFAFNATNEAFMAVFAISIVLLPLNWPVRLGLFLVAILSFQLVWIQWSAAGIRLAFDQITSDSIGSLRLAFERSVHFTMPFVAMTILRFGLRFKFATREATDGAPFKFSIRTLLFATTCIAAILFISQFLRQNLNAPDTVLFVIDAARLSVVSITGLVAIGADRGRAVKLGSTLVLNVVLCLLICYVFKLDNYTMNWIGYAVIQVAVIFVALPLMRTNA